MMSIKIKKGPLWTFIIFCLLAACAINPVTGKRELSLISEQEEIALGQSTDKEIQAIYGIYSDQRLNEYVRNVGGSLAPQTHRSHLTYHFAVLDSPVINAFAVPGGYIYVTRGILAMMSSEGELAAVLAHELGHVNAKHSVRRMSQMMLVQVGFAVGGALSETFAELSGAAGIGMQLLFLKFSRSDERQADSLGVEYSRKSSYNPGEMVSFFMTLQSLGDLSGGQSLPGFLSTHPLTIERIENTKGMLLDSDKQLQIRRPNYLNKLTNMVYGENPQQGYIEGRTFYHPQMRFLFAFPENWKVQNQASQVILVSKDDNAALILQAEKSSNNLKDYAAKKTSQIDGRQFINERNLRINGLSSFEQLYDVSQQGKDPLRIRMTFIKKGSFIYSFAALSTKENFGKYNSSLSSTVASFEELSSPSYLNRYPKRMQLVKASGKESLQQIFQKARLEKDLWQKFAIMNGIKLDQSPARDHLVKIIK
jgi:predicted Zn-dependent protease